MKKKLIIKQEEPSDCGVCCLLSIIRYYGGNNSLEELRISSLTTVEGVNAYNLIRCAIDYGFDSVGMMFESIPDKLPCIGHIKINNALSHFVVIYAIKGNKVVLMDPTCGYKEMIINDYLNISTNKYILLTPKTKLKYSYNKNTFINKIKQTFKSNKKSLMSILIIYMLFLLLSLIYSSYILILKKYNNMYVLLLFILLIIITHYLQYIINNKTNRFNNKMSLNLITSFLNHIFSLPLNYIHIKDSNEIIKRVQDLDSIKEIISSFIITLISNLLIIITISIILACIDLTLICFIILIFVGYLLITYISSRNITDNINEVISYEEDYQSDLIDSINGLISIKHSNSEKYYINKLVDSYNLAINKRYDYYKYNMKLDFLKQSYISVIEFIINAYLIYLIYKGIQSFEMFIIINTIFGILFNSVIAIGNYIPMLLYQHKITIKINEFYNYAEESISSKKIEAHDIVFKNLSFSYNKYKYVLDNVNLKINNKDKIIIKGDSGSGKSTICKILNKEYDDYLGDIYIGNHNYKDLDISSIRNIISYTSQNEKIMKGSIKDNILMGHEISHEKLDEIIYVCCLDRLIKNKPFGLDTYLYGGGSELSGGERQLVYLARSLVQDKSIIILDETLSEVNDKVEDKILNRMFKVYNDKTIIYVSHKNKKNYFKKTIYV